MGGGVLALPGAGIILGAQWAYTQLGWGGYWSWDPVENASLLPWLTGTAMLHTMLVQRQRGIFRRWTAATIATTFLLCILATYITRSGAISSVHAFPKSIMGTFFLVFLALATVGVIGLIVTRWNDLAPQHPVETIISREGAILVGNILLVLMMAVTAIGTLLPLLTSLTIGESKSVNAPFYNNAILPMGLALVMLMGIAPALGYGRANNGNLRMRLLPVAIGAHVAIVALLVINIRSPWALAAAGVSAAVVMAIVTSLVQMAMLRHQSHGESLALAAWRTLRLNHRRYGAHLVHLSVAMITVGVAGSSLYTDKTLVQLAPGQSTQVHGYTLALRDLGPSDGPNYGTYAGSLAVTDSSGSVRVLTPERRKYNKADQEQAIVQLNTNWREDLYVTLVSGQMMAEQGPIIDPGIRAFPAAMARTARSRWPAPVSPGRRRYDRPCRRCPSGRSG